LTRTVTITDNESGKQADFPVREAKEGSHGINIKTLHKELGMYTYDPGFLGTCSCASDITFIDGGKGILRYRGIPIEQLAEHSTFTEVCYLLLHGELPDTKQLEDFNHNITDHTLLHEGMRRFINGFNHDAHPMAMLVGSVGALSAFYPSASKVHDHGVQDRAAYRLLAKMPTIAAWSYKHSKGQPFIYPQNSLSYVENYLHMMFAFPTEDYTPDPLHVKALDLMLILHADHEQNASTSTVRLAGSSEANPYAAISAGISSLWGPSHGGANEKVIRMLTDITESDKTVQDYVELAKDKNSGVRLMGFGHRVYKNFDPRAKLIRDMCHKLLKEMGGSSPLLDTAMELERIALEDDYFIERKLYPNVDFYSGIILRRLGIPLNMFTVIFAMARTVGWISHWREMLRDDEFRIGRPRQVYEGSGLRDYVDISKR